MILFNCRIKELLFGQMGVRINMSAKATGFKCNFRLVKNTSAKTAGKPNIVIPFRELIDRIDVYEVTGTGKNRNQTIKIHWRFVGYLELPSLNNHRNFKEETRKGVALEYSTSPIPA